MQGLDHLNIEDRPDMIPHGGRLVAARRLYPDAPEPWIDLSTGINPVPYPIPTIDPAAFERLPEPEAEHGLRQAAAFAYRVPDPALVVPAPGTQLLISLLPHLIRAPACRVLEPTYAEHRAAWMAANATVTPAHTLDELTAAPVGVLCNPNNPDGTRHDPAIVLALADRMVAHGGLLIVDEAFADFDPALSVAPYLPHPGLLVLRSFGKAYGLAGLRLGFALTAEPLARRIARALGPWAVSGPAALIATTALKDHLWLQAAARHRAADASRLDALLPRAGLAPAGGTALFRLAEGPAAPVIYDRLANAGILTRRFVAYPAWLRFGLPADAVAWERLERALRG